MCSKINYEIYEITSANDELWHKTSKYAKNCSWQPTGKFLSDKMNTNDFLDWERVFVVLYNNLVIGFCAFTKDSAVLGETYSPYLGFLFVDELYRGNHISKKMCKNVIEYARTANFDKVFLYSDLVSFYEKLGFEKIDKVDTSWGVEHTVYVKSTK